MEHEILFRGKRVDNGKWFYDNIVFTRSGRAFKLEGSFFIGETHEGDFERGEIYGTEVIPETVVRYTGLTDKNGIKIFEGDIVRYTYRSKGGENKEYLCVVSREAGAFGIAYGTYHHGNVWLTFDVDFGEHCDNFISFFELMWNSDNPDCMTENYVDCVEVIGNIHNNPELLGTEE